MIAASRSLHSLPSLEYQRKMLETLRRDLSTRPQVSPCASRLRHERVGSSCITALVPSQQRKRADLDDGLPRGVGVQGAH